MEEKETIKEETKGICRNVLITDNVNVGGEAMQAATIHSFVKYIIKE